MREAASDRTGGQDRIDITLRQFHFDDDTASVKPKPKKHWQLDAEQVYYSAKSGYRDSYSFSLFGREAQRKESALLSKLAECRTAQEKLATLEKGECHETERDIL